MIDEQLEEQASLYVFGALEPDAARAFEEQLAADDELRRYVDELSETVAQLAHAAPPRALPANLEARILAEIRETKSEPRGVAFGAWIPWALAACLAIACVIAFADRQQLARQLAAVRNETADFDAQLAASRRQIAEAESRITALAAEKQRAEQQVVELQRREADARTQMATLAAARDDAAKKLAQLEARQERQEREPRDPQPTPQAQPPQEQLAGPGDRDGDALAKLHVATLASKMSDAPNAKAALVWDGARQRGVLDLSNVPPNSEDRNYQLWIVDSRFNQPVGAGVFSVPRSGTMRYVFTPRQRIESPVSFAVTLERKGGVVKAEGPTVLAGR
jgi:anti-sigma-K factor RskA